MSACDHEYWYDGADCGRGPLCSKCGAEAPREAPRERIVSVEDGGDWYDASYRLLIVPADLDLEAAKAQWETWYREEYGKSCSRFISFDEWLVGLGARPCPHETVEAP